MTEESTDYEKPAVESKTDVKGIMGGKWGGGKGKDKGGGGYR